MYRKFRLTGTEDFQRVRRDGRSWAHPLVILIARPNSLPQPRVGFAAGRRVGSAPARNRAKRLMRESVRRNLSQIQSGWDIVFLARTPLAEATYAETEAAVMKLLRRAKLRIAEEAEGSEHNQ